MRTLITTALAVTVLSAAMAAAPPARATPGLVDLADLDAVDDDVNFTFSSYGAGGWQFVTPSGIRCRIITWNRWNGPATLDCWGQLPGLDDDENHAYAGLQWTDDASQAPAAGFDVADISSLNYDDYVEPESDPPGLHAVDADTYHLLPVGSKLIAKAVEGNITCGVVASDEIVCAVNILGSFGFVLSPAGSQTLWG